MEHSFLHSKKILLVDDQPELLTLVREILTDDGFCHLASAGTVEQALSVCRTQRPDLAILDVMLPDGDGFSLLKQLRQFSEMPVLFLTARDEADDKLAGLGLGADDYIVKPFLPQELLLRVHAVLRRCYKDAGEQIQLAACTVDFSRAEVYRQDQTLALTAKEHALLETLARNEGEALWGENPFGYENSLNAHVRRVREKIEADPSHPVSLITVKGLGYKLIVR